MVSRLVDLWITFALSFHVFGPFFRNCKQSARQLLVCFMMHFWVKKYFQLLNLLARPVWNLWSKYLSRLRSRLVGVTTFLTSLKKSIEQSNG